jgi:O-antigen/teichoic acid export membrane protein
VLSVALIPRWGMNGAAAAGATSLVLWNTVLWWRVRRRLPIVPSVVGPRTPRRLA